MRLLAASALVLASCTPALAPLDVPAGCQPLLGTDCLLPYPSDFFLVDDAAQPSGKAVRVAPAAQPRTRAGAPFDVTAEQAIDGFSTVPTIVAMLDAELSPEGFVRLEDGGDLSLSKETSNTLLLDADTGATVPHFVDLDPRTKDTRRQAIIVQPFVGLKERTRYVVLLKGVRTKDGALAPAPEGFRRLRDGLAGSDPALAPLARAFDARLAPLAQQVGVSRAELQLAWEFTTGSSEWATRDLLRVRALTLSWLAENAPAVRVTDTREAPEDDTFRVVRGFVTGPRFCTNDAQPGCRLVRGDDGRVAQAGTVEFPFIAVIPKSAAMAPGPSPLFLFGHGFFGNLSEVDGGAARRIASETARTMVATEWWGMHFSDVGPVGDALT
ncbi:MAG: hypothetical protein INH41_20460, partial [Myxococcaceae bacterium]|nr:hypothetical protein [Myxococcaceae bacterium]